MRALSVGWTPTDAGLVVNLEQGDRFLLSVWVDMNGNGTEEDGEEFFVSNYTRFTGGYYEYGAGTYMKLLPATEVTEMNEWSVGAPLDRGNKALGGIVYTIWNDGKTLKTSDAFKFLGDLTDNYADGKACDVVFVIPTERGVPDVNRSPDKAPISFDPEGTLGRGKDPFNGRMGTGFLGMTYREVYMFDIPKANSPQSYTNAALVTFNTTLGNKSWSAGTIAKGRAAYAFADKKHDKTTRTLFRLYLLDDPINSCSGYFFATDEQDYVRYRMNENNSQKSSDSTAAKKIYTMDRMFCMNPADEEHCVQTDYMYVPEPDSTYYYVGYNNTYIDDDETMGTHGAKSNFTQIRELTILGLADTLKAPAGAFGRMVADTTSALDNLNVKFKPAGYFCKINNGTNIQMRPNADSTIWTCEEMWHITDAYAAMQIKATMFSGPEYSPTDEGIDIPGWSVFVTGTSVPLADDHTQHVTGGMDGWARIYANRSEPNGYMEFILANPRYHIHYDYNGLLGTPVPDQYPGDHLTTVTVESPRLVNGFNFTGWNTKADGSGRTYQPNDVVDLDTFPKSSLVNDSILTLYAQGSYTGTYHVAFSFMHSNGKRYFLTQPIGETNRYVRARPVGDWTDTYQGMSDPYNTEPNYISTYKLIGHPTCALCDHETSYEYVLDPRREWRYGAKDSLLFYSNFAPANDVYLGLYYDDRSTPFKDPVTIVANNTWAGAFTSTSDTTATGWPNYRVADVQNTKLKSEYYFDGFMEGGEIERKERPSKDSSFVKYNEELNQFDGVRTEGEATTFQISRVRVADEHYVVLPDTTSHIWSDTIEFAYHNGEQSREQVWTSMIGKQLLAVTKAGNDTVYFHPDPDHILHDPNNLYLDKNYRVSQVFEYIPDSRVSTAVAEEDRATHETTSYHWHNDIVSGLNSPIDVKDAGGNYIDIVDTFRITMSHGGISKVKQYYGRWKKGARGLKVNGDGSVRTRDVIVRTKTYHYGETITHLVLKPEFKSYIFSPLAGNSQVINFTLANVTAHRLVDVDGNPIGEEEVISSEDITDSLRLGPSACSFSSGGTHFEIVKDGAVSQHVTLATRDQNKEVDNHDTLIISMSVTYRGKEYPVTARVPLVQTSLEGDELIWSVESGKKRYYIMAGTGGLIFRQYALKDGTLYKEGTQNTALIKGSKDAANSDKQYITPWRFRYNPSNANQLALKTEGLVNRYFKMQGDAVGSKGDVHATDSSLLTFHYVDVLTNNNANEEEQVKLQYGADKWLQFTLTGGSGAELVLVDDEEDASVFSWSYLQQEYSLLNNGAYP
ncbi:MAG: InlB B-repeat-containing protein, partial [Paludibacteraceae bacterium]|nr:InlB B-repeat-containing protein [Paludibacteraceae bacterium]